MSKTPITEEQAEKALAIFKDRMWRYGEIPAMVDALQSAADTPPDIDQVATRIASKYLTLDISCERLYHDVVEALTAERAVASRKAAADTPPPQSHSRASILEEAARIADEHAAADMHLRDKAKEAKDATGVFVHAAEAATGRSIAAAIRALATTPSRQTNMAGMSEATARRVLKLLDVYAPDIFTLEMAATVASAALDASEGEADGE